MEKYILVAYNPLNFDDRSYICFNNEKGVNLFQIDEYTSRYTKENMYNELLKLNLIKEDHIEFVIWNKEKIKNKPNHIIKQTPVIFNNGNIYRSSRYLYLKDAFDKNNKIKLSIQDKEVLSKENAANLSTLRNNVFENLIHGVDRDSIKWDEEKYDLDSSEYFSTIIYNVPFLQKTFRTKIKNRIYGTPDRHKIKELEYYGIEVDQEVIDKKARVKDDTNQTKNYYDIKNIINSNYSIYRNLVYLFSNSGEIINSYKDIDYEKLFNISNIETAKNDMINIAKYLYNYTFLDLLCHSKLPEKFKDYANRFYYSIDENLEDNQESNRLKNELNKMANKSSNKKKVLELIKKYETDETE